MELYAFHDVFAIAVGLTLLSRRLLGGDLWTYVAVQNEGRGLDGSEAKFILYQLLKGLDVSPSLPDVTAADRTEPSRAHTVSPPGDWDQSPGYVADI